MTQLLTAEELSYNAARAGQIRHTLFWVQPRDRATGDLEPVGFWTGDDDRSFVIGGQSRLYYGAGAAILSDDIRGSIGLDVRYIAVKLGVVDEVVNAVRGYDLRLAPAEIHTVAFDLATMNPVAAPRRVFAGSVNEASLPTPQQGGDAQIEVRLASSARSLTLSLPLYRSDAEMRRRNPADAFRRHVSTTGLRQVAWGEAQVSNG